ncbi:GH24948 [Drosophila grimshawi]|uniref:GH24948 n=1 Tax=Drosophila grimshawi TaxID=7222 RepID=B4K0D2_DROGR|nr:GH24948 [Drosophila grimshawi]
MLMLSDFKCLLSLCSELGNSNINSNSVTVSIRFILNNNLNSNRSSSNNNLHRFSKIYRRFLSNSTKRKIDVTKFARCLVIQSTPSNNRNTRSNTSSSNARSSNTNSNSTYSKNGSNSDDIVWNVNGLANDVNELELFIPRHQIDVMLVCETHSCSRSHYRLPGYGIRLGMLNTISGVQRWTLAVGLRLRIA